MEEGAEEARKVDVEKQKGEEEAVVMDPAVMGEHFVNQSALLKRKLKPDRSTQQSSSDFFFFSQSYVIIVKTQGMLCKIEFKRSGEDEAGFKFKIGRGYKAP